MVLAHPVMRSPQSFCFREMTILETIKPILHHVTLKTSHLQQMVDWYTAVIGAEVQFQDEYNAWTTNDGANHRLAFLAVPGLENDPEKIKHNGIHHTAFEYDSFPDLMSSYVRLREHGIVPAFCLNHGNNMSIYYQDPEGNYVELQSDNFGDWRLSGAFIRDSDDFRANPIGTFFDPAKVYDAHAAGRSFVELQPAVRNGEFLPDPIPPLGLPSKVAEALANFP